MLRGKQRRKAARTLSQEAFLLPVWMMKMTTTKKVMVTRMGNSCKHEQQQRQGLVRVQTTPRKYAGDKNECRGC